MSAYPAPRVAIALIIPPTPLNALWGRTIRLLDPTLRHLACFAPQDILGRQLALLIQRAVVCAPRVAIALGLPPTLLIALWGHTIRPLDPTLRHLACFVLVVSLGHYAAFLIHLAVGNVKRVFIVQLDL